jgi:subtilisin family serine protease
MTAITSKLKGEKMKRGKIIVSMMAVTLLISQSASTFSFAQNDVSQNFNAFGMNGRYIMPNQNQRNNVTSPPMMQSPNNKTTVTPVNQDVITNIGTTQNDLFSDLDIDADDPGLSSQWYLARTNSYLLWDYIEDVQDETAYVAVLDTGVDYDHVDLENRVDEDMGYDFVNNDSDPMDDNGHGTHVAGIIAAEMDNDEGIVGIVGNLDVVIIPIKVLDEDGTGTADDVVDGIEYAIEQGADIINLSFGTSSLDDDEIDDIEDAIAEAIDENIFVVAAAGNESIDCDDYIPAGLDNVYTVTASATNNLLTSYSNYGDSVEVMAPGASIVSTYLNNSYSKQDGTSMAAPIVSGIAAMLLAYDEDLTVDEITDYLNDSANYLEAYDDMTHGDDIGYGLIDAAGAFEEMTDKDIYDEDDYVDELDLAAENTTIQTPQNMAPNMNVGSSNQQQSRRP